MTSYFDLLPINYFEMMGEGIEPSAELAAMDEDAVQSTLITRVGYRILFPKNVISKIKNLFPEGELAPGFCKHPINVTVKFKSPFKEGQRWDQQMLHSWFKEKACAHRNPGSCSLYKIYYRIILKDGASNNGDSPKYTKESIMVAYVIMADGEELYFTIYNTIVAPPPPPPPAVAVASTMTSHELKNLVNSRANRFEILVKKKHSPKCEREI